MKSKLLGLLAAGLLAGPSAVHANPIVIVDQLTSTNVGVVGTISDFDFPFQIADGFAVTSDRPVAVTRVEWVGSSSFAVGGPALDLFSIRFYQAQGGGPSDNPFVDLDVSSFFVESPTGNPVLSLFTADIERRIVLSSKDYFISIVADTANSAGTWSWFFLDGATASYGRALDGDNWDQRSPRSYSFRITGTTVPEPGTLALLSLGLAGLGLARRKRAA